MHPVAMAIQNGALPCETNKVSCEIIAWFMCVWRCISSTSELGSVQVHCVAKRRQVPSESARTGEYHRDELIPTDGFHHFISWDLLPLVILCFCFFVFGESRGKWVQVLTTSFLCALICSDSLWLAHLYLYNIQIFISLLYFIFILLLFNLCFWMVGWHQFCS